MTSSRVTTIVGGGRVVRVVVESDDEPRLMRVTIGVGFDREWSFDEPGWRELGYGVVNDEIFVWSARHLVVLPKVAADDVGEVRTDEDILFVFGVADGWLVVCETSVRLYVAGGEASRVELGEVALTAVWDAPVLSIRDASDDTITVRLANGELKAQAASR